MSDDMSNLVYWKLSEEAKEILKDIEVEIQESKDSLAEGVLLIHQDDHKLAREYAAVIGRIEGLKFLKEKLSRGEIEQV